MLRSATSPLCMPMSSQAPHWMLSAGRPRARRSCGERVEAGVGRGVVGHARQAETRTDRREQHEEIELGQEPIEIQRAAPAWAARRAGRSAAIHVRARGGSPAHPPHGSRRGSAASASSAIARERARRSCASSQTSTCSRCTAAPACSSARTAAMRCPSRASTAVAAHVERGGKPLRPTAPGAARPAPPCLRARSQADVAEPAGDQVGGVGAPRAPALGPTGLVVSGCEPQREALAAAQGDLVLGVARAQVSAQRSRAVSAASRRIEVDQATPQLGMLLGDHAASAPERLRVHRRRAPRGCAVHGLRAAWSRTTAAARSSGLPHARQGLQRLARAGQPHRARQASTTSCPSHDATRLGVRAAAASRRSRGRATRRRPLAAPAARPSRARRAHRRRDHDSRPRSSPRCCVRCRTRRAPPSAMHVEPASAASAVDASICSRLAGGAPAICGLPTQCRSRCHG